MPESASAPPQVNERYDIKEPAIGRGGMGVVYKAYDNKTRRFVALKTISGEVDAAALELFEREWNVLARLSHPNIVDILDTGEYPENGHRKPFFVMPLLPGSTLDRLIKTSNQRLTVERTVEILCQACRGLQAAHEQGLVHRDIKPSNIFVMDDDTVKIIDFGVVHLADARTITGLKGTPHYMSPEQVDGKPANALSDIFSLSVVTYEALTGRKPFVSRNDAELFDAIRTYIPPAASELNPAVNHLISRTVHKGMAKQPWHRFSSAKEFADILQRALRNEPIERFERSKIQPRIERVKKAYAEGDYQFATEILTELESEGHMDPEMSILRLQLDQAVRTKTIRQLLDSARTRMEEDEYPLALQKIQDVLNLDPNNVDATALRRQIEKQRGAKQIENWFRLVAQHLDNQDYPQARQGLEEILKIDTANTRARELLSGLERSEQELSKIREEQQKLYDAAVASYRNGEISTALSNLERLMQMKRSIVKPTDRDAQYLSLYNQIRSEREAAHSAYAEGRKCLADRNFGKTLEICDDYLSKHPGDPLFQALKLEAVEIQRQEQSAAIAEISRRVEAEPDLDKKYNIIKQAVERYPTESQFQSQLKLVKDRRELVNSIVARAQQYEERGQLNDSAGQWDILRNIYPAYPGLDVDVQRLARRREEQVTEEAKARWVERIDRHINAGEYSKAREAVRQAVAEFPNDQELRGLDSLAEHALKRSEEAAALLAQGQQLIEAGHFESGIELLRKAERLDDRSAAARASLIGALLQRARDAMGTDWRTAEPLVKEVLDLEPADPVARSLTSLIADYKRQEAVSQLLLEARTLQGTGDIEGALAKAERGLQTFPNESRLLQLQHTLRGAIGENRRKDSVAPHAGPPAEPSGPTILMPAHAPTAATSPVAPANDVPPQAKPRLAQPVPATTKTESAKRPVTKSGLLIISAAGAALALLAAAILVTARHHSTMEVGSKQSARVPATIPPAPPSKPVPADVHVGLPELRIASDLTGVRVLFDQEAAANVQDGVFTKEDVHAGEHHVALRSTGNTKLFDFTFTVKPSGLPMLPSQPSGTIPGVVVATFGSDAIVYGSPTVKGGVEGQPVKPISGDGDRLTLPAAGLRYVLDDGRGKPHTISIDVLSNPLLNVILSGAPETIPFTVTANVPDATLLINGREVKRHLSGGSLTTRMPAGKYRVSVTAEDYEPAGEQMLELKPGAAPAQTLQFTLNRIAHAATVIVENAPADTEVLLDGNSWATISSGTFKKEVPPGPHTITLRKPNYVELPHFYQLTAGQSVSLNAAEMKQFGKLTVKVTPANAHVTYRLHGDKEDKSLLNNQDNSVPPGDYSLHAEAEGFVPTSQDVSVTAGKETSYVVGLTPAHNTPETITPAKIFEDGKSWTYSDPNGWWTHAGRGFSFTNRGEGTLNFTLPKEPKQYLKGVRNYQFVVDYRDEDNMTLYTLDARRLTRKVYADGKEVKEERSETPVSRNDVYRLAVQIGADTITVRVNGASDTFKRSQAHGKFGFLNEVILIPR